MLNCTDTDERRLVCIIIDNVGYSIQDFSFWKLFCALVPW